jgi:hypothetical protein
MESPAEIVGNIPTFVGARVGERPAVPRQRTADIL